MYVLIIVWYPTPFEEMGSRKTPLAQLLSVELKGLPKLEM